MARRTAYCSKGSSTLSPNPPAGPPRVVPPEPRLERQIGFWGLLAMSLGINIGGSLFALTTLAAGHSGPVLPLAILASATPVFLALVPFCVLSLAHSTTSATYRYAQKVSPSIALMNALTSLVCICGGGLPLFALVAGTSLEGLLPASPVAIGALALTIFYAVNVIGIGFTARIQLLLTFCLVAALCLFIGAGLPEMSEANFRPLLPTGTTGVLVAAGLLYTFCSGGLFIVELGDEIVDARRNLPRALTTGMVLALVLYVGIMLVTVGVIPFSELEGRSLVAVAETFLSPNAAFFFALGGALVASVTTINGVMALQARLMLVLAEEELLPSVLGGVSTRFGTPHGALTLVYAISLVSLVAVPSIDVFASMLNLTMILSVTIVTLGALRVATEHPELCRHPALTVAPRTLRIICWAIIAMNLVIAGFFAIRMGWISVGFGALLGLTWTYARLRPDRMRANQVRSDRLWARL